MNLIISSIICLLSTLISFSQTSKNVISEYTYIAPTSLSLDQAKAIALQRAKIQVIADEFGTIISQTNHTQISNNRNNTEIDFQSIGLSDLRGEWVETFGKPEYDITYSDELLCIHVIVKGKIRQINEFYAPIKTKLLRNSTDLRFESTEFRNNDDFYLYLASPINGYLSVYLIDNCNNAFCLLPYARQQDGVYQIEANKEYIFFSKECSSLHDTTLVDEYVMTCNDVVEYNRIAVIFSENKFIKSADISISENLPRTLQLQDLNLWVAKARNHDLKMQYFEIPFTITP